MGFTKLDSGIVDSSIWSEPPTTRVVWITMLAKSDRTGLVRCSWDGLLRASNISKDLFEAAIACLESEDKNSRSSGFEGRRIEKVEGGWLILNYLKYRDYNYSNNPESIRKREYRHEKSGTRPKVSQDTSGHSASASASASAFEAGEGISAEDIYQAYPLKVGKPMALRSISKAMQKMPPETLLKLTKAYAARRGGDLSFTPHPATWFNQERFNDDPSTWERTETTNGKPKLVPDYEKGF